MSSIAPQQLSDGELLRQFATSRSPEAFAELVKRHLPLIYSSALRQTRDAHLAEDVAQATLIIFSQRASKIDPPILVGWLIKTTHFVSRNAIRHQARRIRHEQRAAAMKDESQPSGDSINADALSHVIDPALARLRDIDRTAVVLRYFENKSFAEIAALLKTTESAAQRRISRAIEKLRGILAGQGFTVAPTMLPALLSAQTLHSVPTSLSTHALGLSSALGSSNSLMVKGALKAMATATKLKVTGAVVIAALLIGATVPAAYHYMHRSSAAVVQPILSTAPIAWLPKGTDVSIPISGSLPPGVTFEPLGIMRLADGRWMKPTGEPLTDLPAKVSTELPDLVKLAKRRSYDATYAFLWRTKLSIPPDRRSALSIQTSLLGGQHDAMTAWADPQIQNLDMRYDLRVFDPKPNADSVKLSVDVGAGPWTNVGTISATATAPAEISAQGLGATLYPPTESSKGAQIKYRESESSPDQETRFYALTKSGEEIDAVSYDDLSTPLMRYTFDVPLSNIREFRVDARPYNYHATYAAVPLNH